MVKVIGNKKNVAGCGLGCYSQMLSYTATGVVTDLPWLKVESMI